MILGSEGRLGIITERHGARAPGAGASARSSATCSRPGQASLAAMRDIAAAEAHPSVTRVSDPEETQFSFATKKTSGPLDKLQVERADGVPPAPRGLRPRSRCASPSSATRAARGTSRRSASAVGRIVSRHGGLCIGSGPGELYDQKKFDTPYIRDFLLDRGDPRRRVRDRGAVERARPRSTRDATAAARGAFARLGVPGYVMCHLSHSYHSGACLYFTFALVPCGGAGAARGVRRGQGRRSSRRSSTRARRCRTTTRWGRSTPAGWSRTSPRPASRCCGRCSTASTRAPTSTRARSSEPCRRRTRSATIGACTSKVHPPGRRRAGGRVRRRRRQPAARRGRARRSRSPRRGRDAPPRARPRSAVRAADMVASWASAGRSGSTGPQQPAPWPPGGAWLDGRVRRGPGTTRRRRDCSAGSTPGTRARARRAVLGARGRIAGVVEAGGAIEVHRDGFRAERARPYAFFVTPRANAALVGRLAAAYRAEVVRAAGADAVLAWCRARGLGLDAAVVDELLGPRGRRRGAPRAARGPRAAARRRRGRDRGACSSSASSSTGEPGGPRRCYGRTGRSRARRSGRTATSTSKRRRSAALPTLTSRAGETSGRRRGARGSRR